MANETSQKIGLSELIDQVKKDLLSPPSAEAEPPILFVEAVELELKVAARREGNAGVKVDVLAIGGGEVGGGLSQEKTHTVKVKLSPLFDKAQLLEWYKDLRGDQVLPSVASSLDALIKGDDENLGDRF
jgi:hypothetical protein